MGLFSKIFGRKAHGKPLEALFTEREVEFNREVLEKSIIRTSELLYEHKNDPGHDVYSSYIRQILNLETLKLAEGTKLDGETYAYRRGRIDGLRNVLNAREVYIKNKDLLRKSQTKGPGEQEAKRSYVRAPSTQAGLSI